MFFNQGKQWSKHITTGISALERHNFQDARDRFSKALQVAEKSFSPDDKRLGRSYYYVAHVDVFGTGVVMGADSLYKKALDIMEGSADSGDQNLRLKILYELGETLSRQGKSADAIPFLETAISTAHMNPGMHDEICARGSYSLGICYALNQKFDAAIKQLEYSREMFQTNNMLEDLYSVLHDLSEIYKLSGNEAKAAAACESIQELERRLT